jgi:signal transduction histidine kinase
VRARNDLLAVVSHDLRNPLSAILLQTEVLSQRAHGDDEIARRSRASAERIRRSATHMKALIDDLLDLARIETQRFALQLEAVDSRAMVEEARLAASATAEAKQITLAVESIDSATVKADPARIFRVLTNLIDNAIKFTPAGAPVVVRVWRQSGKPGFSVEDLGPGIPRAERDKIFQRFYQIDRSRSKTRPGSGLGLAIVKHIAQLHGAGVDVDGDVGQGSTFHVRFPAIA